MTAKELAKIIGVSEATMSLVINGKSGLSDKTRTKVIRRMEELGYSDMLQFEKKKIAAPNTLPDTAKQIAFINYRNKGELLELNSFFPLILEGIEIAARRDGYRLTVMNIDRKTAAEQLADINASDYAGFVVFATEMHEEDADLLSTPGLPFVILDNEFYDIQADCVKLNNQQGTYVAVRHLVEAGHTRIGYLSSGVDINSFHERRSRAIEAMTHFGIKDAASHIYTVGYPHENAETGMAEVLRTHTKEELPTAFLADNDLVSVGAVQAVKNAGYRVPEDFSFVGFDDRPVCTMMTPKLSTVAIPREIFGAIAVERLINRLKGGSNVDTTLEINCRLVERDSVLKIK